MRRALGQADRAQRGRLTALLRAVLSPQGMEMVIEQMQADDILARKEPAMFGGSLFRQHGWEAVVRPCLDAPVWRPSPAINAIVAGPHVTLSPSLSVSGEPPVHPQRQA